MTSAPLGPDTDAFDMLARSTQRFEALRVRGVDAQARLAENHTTATSPDGAVTVTVNAGGQLEQLRLGAKADGKSAPQLTEAILKTYRKACAEAVARTIDIMSDLSGENSITVSTLKSSLPSEVASEVEEIRREEGRVI